MSKKNPAKRVIDTLQDFWPDLSSFPRYWSLVIGFAVIINSRSPGASFVELLLRALRKLLIVRK